MLESVGSFLCGSESKNRLYPRRNINCWLTEHPHPKAQLKKKNKISAILARLRPVPARFQGSLSEQAQPPPDPARSRQVPRVPPAPYLFLTAGSFASDALLTLFYLSPTVDRITFRSAVRERNNH